jgi:hypothetical protein
MLLRRRALIPVCVLLPKPTCIADAIGEFEM